MESPFPEPVPAGTRLIETFGCWPGTGARRIDRHLARMAESARCLGFAFRQADARELIADLSDAAPLRCRLTLGVSGDLDLATVPLPPMPDRPWRVAIHPARLRADDPWLVHKTTERALYDRARASMPEGVDEWLFLNELGELCEGTITNLFVTLPDGRRITPPVASGLLPGILRAEMLERGAIVEAVVTPDMLSAATLHLGNSLRGEIAARLV